MKINIFLILCSLVICGCDEINNPSYSNLLNPPVVYISNGQVTIVDLDGTNKHTITASNNWNSRPVFNKDKSKIVFESYRDNDTEIYLINSDGSNEKRLTNRIGIDENPSFSPDGSKVIYSSADNHICTIDIETNSETRLTADGYNVLPVYSPDGSKIAYININQGFQNLFIMDSDGQNKQQLTTPFRDAVSPSFSSDEKYIAFVASEQQLFVYDLLNNNYTLLPIDSMKVGFPLFTPDNSKIVFQGLVWPNHDIYSINPDGSNLKMLTDSTSLDFEPKISSKGDKIVWEVMGTRFINIYRMDINGDNKRQLTNGNNDHDPSF